ncbi:hypothetical protein FRC07_009391 [Ceratobasidium sp. 392]|nr:hypothetical protein FRC07_009391 [Ceratobasidium sp. 392]
MPPGRSNTRAMRPTTTPVENDTLAVHGRRMTRTVDMWWAGADIVSIGKEMDSATDDQLAEMRESATGRQVTRMMELVDHLNVLEPGFFERLNRAGTHAAAAARNARDRLNDGQSNARSEDARKVFLAMANWGPWIEPLGVDRLTRGLKHRECATLLAPPTLNMADDNVAKAFMVDGIPAMAPEIFAAFMWAKGQFNRQQPSNGLFEGELMFSAGTAILFSPSSSMQETIQAAGGARGHIRRRGPIGLAKKYELTEVNTAFIAYVACVTRHALTGARNFSEVCDGFSYTRFYYLIRKILEAPKYEHWTKGLIQRWNDKLFAGYEFGLNAVEPTDEANAILNMLDAELEGSLITPDEVGLGSEEAD